MNENVKIRLYDKTGRTRILGIVDNTPNDGSYRWTIPGSLRSNEYVVRVKTIDNRFFDDSDSYNIRSIEIREIPPPTVELGPPEVKIVGMSRVGTGVIRVGGTVSVDVRVRNNGSSDADVFVTWITIPPPFFDVRSRSNHTIISRRVEKSFRLAIPVTARNFRNGKFKVKFFVGDTSVREDNVFKVLFRDSDLEDHQKEFTNIASSNIVIRISSVRNTIVSTWHTKQPTFAFCGKTELPTKIRTHPNKVLLGQLNLWKPGADPFPCHNGTLHNFYGAANFDISRLGGLEISQVILKFKREETYEPDLVFRYPNSENPNVMVIQIGNDTIETRQNIFTSRGLGEIRPRGFLDVTEVIRSLIRRGGSSAGFSFAQARVTLHRYDNDARLFHYEFEMEVRIAE